MTVQAYDNIKSGSALSTVIPSLLILHTLCINSIYQTASIPILLVNITRICKKYFKVGSTVFPKRKVCDNNTTTGNYIGSFKTLVHL